MTSHSAGAVSILNSATSQAAAAIHASKRRLGRLLGEGGALAPGIADELERLSAIASALESMGQDEANVVPVAVPEDPDAVKG